MRVEYKLSTYDSSPDHRMKPLKNPSSVRVTMPDGTEIDIELFERTGRENMIAIRGINCTLAIMPEVSNCVCIKGIR